MKPLIQAYVDAAEPYAVASTKMLYNAPPVEFLIAGILPTHAICGLTGAPGTGKTWLAMEAMRAVITGTKFLGQFDTQQGPALYVGADASFLDYAQQWYRLTHEVYESYTQHEDDGTVVRLQNPFDLYADFLLQSDFNLDDPEKVGKLIKTSARVERPSYYEEVMTETGWEQVEREGRHYRLIVYDTLTKLTRSPENDSIGRDVVFEHLRDVAEATGATLLVLHHPPLVSEFRSGEEWRGAGSQFGALDAHFHILRDNGREDVIQFKVKKFRGITPKPFLYNMDVFNPETMAATLTYMESGKAAVDFDNELVDAMLAHLDKVKKPQSIADFAIHLMAQEKFNDTYENVAKMKNRLANFLKKETAKPDARFRLVVAGAGRRASLYTVGVIPPSEDSDAEDRPEGR